MKQTAQSDFFSNTLPPTFNKFKAHGVNLGFGRSSYLICPEKLSKELKIVHFTLLQQKSRFEKKLKWLEQRNSEDREDFQQIFKSNEEKASYLREELSKEKQKNSLLEQQSQIKDKELIELRDKLWKNEQEKGEQIQLLTEKVQQLSLRNKRLTHVALRMRQQQKSFRYFEQSQYQQQPPQVLNIRIQLPQSGAIQNSYKSSMKSGFKNSRKVFYSPRNIRTQQLEGYTGFGAAQSCFNLINTERQYNRIKDSTKLSNYKQGVWDSSTIKGFFKSGGKMRHSSLLRDIENYSPEQRLLSDVRKD